MNWIKKDAALSIEQVIERNTGLKIEDFLNPPADVHIEGLQEVANIINDAVSKEEKITIYGDYDCDGITGTSILFLMLTSMGHGNIDVILPKRFSEGYGLSEKGVDRINEGLLITIDNGITAVDEIQKAREKGLTVVIVDHHLPREDGRIPNAHAIVDPNAIPGSDFCGYCGAGLAFKLASLLITDKERLEKLSVLAAIGTIADVMPLVHDNRSIVLRGLSNMNHNIMFPGISALLDELEMYEVSEMDIGFKIGPILNAAGRMRDAGAMEAFKLLTGNRAYAQKAATELIKTNEERKAVVAQSIEFCEQVIEDDCLFGENPLLVYTTKEGFHLHEGIVGILAGRLAEKYKVPAIVLTETEDGILKGSGRSDGNVHLKNLLDTASDLLVGYGGHAGAAGLSVKIDDVETLRQRLQEKVEALKVSPSESTETIYYDLEVNAHQIPAVMEKLKKFAPYGEGNPRICFKVNAMKLAPRAGKFYRLMGSNGQHIKMFAQNCDLVGFDLAKQYRDAQEPMCIDTVGFISENRFGTNTTLQVDLLDFRKREAQKKQSRLSAALQNTLKMKGLT